MEVFEQIRRPSKEEQKAAINSYNALSGILEQISADETEIEIEETKEKIKVPLKALKLFGDILKSMSEGKPVSIVPVETEVTTQKAAEILGCSRPHLVKLLEDGEIVYTKVGKHRRIRLEDVLKYQKQMKENQKRKIIEMMNFDEQKGLYDS
jgi:excisionase family DNA binding protein